MKVWAQEAGFSLLETVIALGIAGTTLIATTVALGGSVRTAARAEESVTLVQLTRAQIETIHKSPFQGDPSDYPIIFDIPEGFTVTVTSTDPGTRYTYPAPDGSAITGVIQEIQVTSSGDFSNVSMSMYKIRMP